MDYVWDLGFDFNHTAKPDGTYDLQIGLVKLIDNKYAPASPIPMALDKSVGFSLYDLTMGAEKDKWDKTIINAAIIQFDAAKPGSRMSPFGEADELHILTPTFKFAAASGVSAYFGGTYPIYHWDGKLPDGGSLKIHQNARQHHCEMTVTVIVTKKKKNEAKYERRRFVVDPEMIIDSNG